MDVDLDSYIKDKGIRYPGRGRGRGGRGQNVRRSNRGRSNFPRRSTSFGGNNRSPRGVFKRSSFGGGELRSSGSSVLHISNLDFGVSDQDIQELFSEFGTLKKYAVHFDRSGRSLGTAEVHYANSSSAARAIKQYNNVPLDGRPMKIEYVSSGPVSVPRSSFPQRRSNSFRGGRGRASGAPGGRGGRGRGGGRGGGARKQPAPSLEDLDADLAKYTEVKDE